MDYAEFLTHVIEDGLQGARADYVKPEQATKLEGSIEGFEACRGKSPDQLKELLGNCRYASQKAFHEQLASAEYWKIRSREVEVEWVCNVVSAMLWANKQPTIITPTVNGTLQAAKLLARTN